jgi:hypothetical protein
LGWIEARARVNCAVIGHTPLNDAIGLPACVSLRAGVAKAPPQGVAAIRVSIHAGDLGMPLKIAGFGAAALASIHARTV